MKEEIYIKGEALDLGDTSIALNFKSNLFGDASKITSSNSYTVSVPKTTKNTRLLNFPDVPAHSSYLKRDYFDCSYFRNGIKIFDGKAVITGATNDSFSIVLSFGISSKLIDMLTGGSMIGEFTDKDGLRFDKYSAYDYTTPDVPADGYYHMYTGVNIDANRDKAFVHPSASAYWILRNMFLRYNIPLPYLDKFKGLKSLYIPCIKQEGVMYNREHISISYNGNIGGFQAINILDKLSEVSAVKTEYWPENDITGVRININSEGKKYRVVYEISGTEDYPYTNPAVTWITNDGGANEFETFWAEEDENGVYRVDKIVDSPTGFFVTVGSITVPKSANVYIYRYDENCNYENHQDNMNYKFSLNLPEIKAIDFLKQLCWINGLFVLSNNNSIYFQSAEDLLNNKSNALDWSHKIMLSGESPMDVSYTIGDFAQENWMRYKENEDAPVADAKLIVDNKTLDESKNLFTLTFKAGGDDSRLDSVPYYEMEESGDIELVDCGDRIMNLFNRVNSNGDSEAYLSFEGLDFETLKSKYYRDYEQIIKEPFVIKDKFKLNELDILNLNYSRPIYIEHYGSFFAVISVQVQGEISTCELLKI